ncbi:MAG: pilin [Patescibacteria group bacterium]
MLSRNKKKKYTAIILVIFIGLFLAANLVLATDETPPKWTKDGCDQAGGWWFESNCWANNPTINLAVPFGGLKPNTTIGIAQYIGAIYRFGISAASVLAIVMIIIGGFIWLTSAGNPTRVTQAKGYIGGALVGLVLALSSYSILRTINPALTEFRPLHILYVGEAPLAIATCCEKDGQMNIIYEANQECPEGQKKVTCPCKELAANECQAGMVKSTNSDKIKTGCYSTGTWMNIGGVYTAGGLRTCAEIEYGEDCSNFGGLFGGQACRNYGKTFTHKGGTGIVPDYPDLFKNICTSDPCQIGPCKFVQTSKDKDGVLQKLNWCIGANEQPPE